MGQLACTPVGLACLLPVPPSLLCLHVALLAGDARDNSELPSRGWRPQPHHPSKAALWHTIRSEAMRDAMKEPALASFLYSSVSSPWS